MRRVTLRPSYTLFGWGEDNVLDAFPYPGDDFDAREREHKNYQRFLKITGVQEGEEAERGFIKNNVVGYTESDWQRVLDVQKYVVFGYIKGLAKRFATSSRDVSDIAPRMVEYGDPVYSEEELAKYRTRAENADSVAVVVLQMQAFEELYPQIRAWFGEDARMKEFLEKLRPERITQRGTFQVPSLDYFD